MRLSQHIAARYVKVIIARGRLIDATNYLSIRREYAFGSARNLKDGSARLSRNQYVPLDILRLNDFSIWSASKIAHDILQGSLTRAILMGDFGAGKSMTLRELNLSLTDAYNDGKTPQFPVYLNLRDHSGQPDPVEVLERHARRIGFPSPSHLVRAWRAGFVALILDGFDELSSTGWMAFNKRLRQVRYQTVESVRRFLDESPHDAPVFVAGRASYFDSEEECLVALGIARANTSIFSLNDFSEKQIRQFLQGLGVQGELPQWLPARPLLVGYLAVRGALDITSDSGKAAGPGEGWDQLLAQVCGREARTHEAVDAETVRSLMEHLASIARSKGGLSAPLSPADMVHAYRHIVGVEPDQRAETLLMRLPGLGSVPEGQGLRAFVDPDFGSAVAAGEVARFVEAPFGDPDAPVRNVKEVLQDTGISVVASQLERRGIQHERIYVAMAAAVDSGDKPVPEHSLGGDLLKLAVSGRFSAPRVDFRVKISGVIYDELDLENCVGNFSGVTIANSLISNLYLPASTDRDLLLPHLVATEIEHVEGRIGPSTLHQEMFREVKFGTFSETADTNAAVLDDPNLEPGVKALVTILRKLFVQKGSGRKENAFFRGVPGIRPFIVEEALQLVSKADYAHKSRFGGSNWIWTPNRRMASRVRLILLSPKGSKEAIVSAARKIAP